MPDNNELNPAESTVQNQDELEQGEASRIAELENLVAQKDQQLASKDTRVCPSTRTSHRPRANA